MSLQRRIASKQFLSTPQPKTVIAGMSEMMIKMLRIGAVQDKQKKVRESTQNEYGGKERRIARTRPPLVRSKGSERKAREQSVEGERTVLKKQEAGKDGGELVVKSANYGGIDSSRQV